MSPFRQSAQRAIPFAVAIACVLTLVTCDLDKIVGGGNTKAGVGLDSTDLKLTGDTLLTLGGTLQMGLTSTTDLSGTVRRWTSGDSTLLRIDSVSALAAGVGVGIAKVTARVLAPELGAGVTVSQSVRVRYKGIRVTAPTVTDSMTGLGQTRVVTVQGLNNGNALVAGTLAPTLTSRDTTVLRVSGSTIVARQNGSTHIVAVFDSFRDSVLFKVRRVAKSITFPTTNYAARAVNYNLGVPLTVKDVADSAILSPTLTWRTSDTTVATVGATTGILRVRKANDTTSFVYAKMDTVERGQRIVVAQVVASLTNFAGDARIDTVARPVKVLPTLTALDSGNTPVAGATVIFRPGVGLNASVTDTLQITDANGRAKPTAWKIGDLAGPSTLLAVSGSATTTFIVTGVAGPARKLAFAANPSSAAIGAVISPAITVQIQDSLGNLVATATNSITLSLSNNPGFATLGGTLTVAAVAGVATFSNITLSAGGSGYALQATSGSLTSTISGAFDVFGTPAKLGFTTQPSGGFAGGVLPTVRVAVQDVNGSTVTTSAASVSIAIAANPGGGTLGGTVSLAAVAGVATFSTLAINAAGNGYTLAASSAGLTGATSASFNVVATSVANVSISPSGATLTGGTPPVFTAAAKDGSGSTISGKTFTWASLNPGVATVNSSTGVVTGVTSGQVTISATADGKVGYALLTVAIPGATPVNLWAPISSGTSRDLTGIWGSGPSNIVGVGDLGTARRFDGAAWSTLTAPTSNLMSKIWGLSGTDMIVVGLSGETFRYDGTAFAAMTSNTNQNQNSIWGSGPTDMFAGADNNTIQRFNGTSWASAGAGSTAIPRGIWGSSSADVFVVGDGGMVRHFDGSTWAAQTSGTSQQLGAAWGFGGGDVFGVGIGGTIRRYNGSNWSGMTSNVTTRLLGIWGSSSTDVYAVGDAGTIVRFDGTSWAQASSGTTTQLNNVWGTRSGNVFAVGNSGLILSGYRSASVTVTPAAPTLTTLGSTQQMTATARDASANTISGVTITWTSSSAAVATVSASGLVTAVANGSATITATASGGASGSTPVTVNQPVVALVIVSPGGASITGGTQQFTAVAKDSSGNTISGKTFTWASLNPSVATINSSTGLATAVASGQVTVSATADGKVGYGVLTVAIPGATPVNLWVPALNGISGQHLYGIWGSSRTDVHALGADGNTQAPIALRFDGTSWQTTPGSPGYYPWGTGPTDVFSSGPNGASHYDGTQWSQIAGSPAVVGTVWGASPKAVFFGGSGGTILRYDGSSWTSTNGVSQTLQAFWGTSADAVFAVGANGTILRYDGSGVTPMSSGTQQQLTGVWGTSASDVYAVGTGGTFLHFNGSAWSALPSLGTGTSPLWIWGSSGSDIYAVGNAGAILRFDGSSWSTMSSGTTENLSRMWGTSADAFVVGVNRTILRGYRGATVSVTPASPTISTLGATQQLTATARDAASNTIGGATFTWASSNTSVATVSASGLVTAIANGTATITATAPGGAAGSATVTVGAVFASVSAGSYHTCGLTTGGSIYCWGYGAGGELGNGSTANSSTPVLVAGGLSFAAVTAGSFGTCGLTTGGAAYCWGNNGNGALGNGTTTSSSTPVAVSGGLTFASLASSADFHMCGVTTGGAAYCWGSNSNGKLGNGSTSSSSTPVAVSGGLSFAAVSASTYHTCGLTTSGAVYCWGDNEVGALGNGSTTGPETCSGSSPFGTSSYGCSKVPVAVSSGLVFASVSAGDNYTCAVTTGGAAYCWGYNRSQLGNGSTGGNSTTPAAVSGGLSFTVVNASISAFPHTCGRTTGGAAHCWGNNPYGQLGNGSTTTSSTPVAVSGGLSFTAMGAGSYHTCGVTSAGAVYCWGNNTYGQLGDGSTTDRTTPVRVVSP